MSNPHERLTINSTKAIYIAFILFFSYRAWYGLLRLGTWSITIIFSVLLVYAFVVLALIISKKMQSKIIAFLGVFCICASIFVITYLLHPSYGTWFFHNADYGVFNSVFYPTAGMYAFLFVSMCEDPDDMRKGLKIVAYLMLIYGAYQLIPVIETGHWDNVSRTGAQVNQNSYSLGFGYRTVMCSIMFFDEFLETKKKRYLALSIGSLVTVVMYGGRGSLMVFVIYLVLRYITSRGSKITSKDIIITVMVTLLALMYVTGVLDVLLSMFFNAVGLSDVRTIDKLLNGEMFEDNARTIIWSMAIDLIKSGGLFGHGMYGDRMVIGRYYSWGYSHNIFLELMVSFGIIGLLLCILLIWKIISFFKKEPDSRWKKLFVIFLCLSCQLLVSDSFWYNSWFWGLLALLYTQKARIKKNQRIE